MAISQIYYNKLTIRVFHMPPIFLKMKNKKLIFLKTKKIGVFDGVLRTEQARKFSKLRLFRWITIFKMSEFFKNLLKIKTKIVINKKQKKK